MAWFGRKKDAPKKDAPQVEETDTPQVKEALEPEEIVEEKSLQGAPGLNEAGFRSMSDHRDYLLGLVEPLNPFGMSSLEALNQVLCEDLSSLIDVPSHSTALVAGYAVRAADLVDDEGQRVETMDIVTDADERLPLGGTLEVAPGDRLPRGASAVLPSTYVAEEGELLRVFEKVAEGEYIRAAGEHLSAGEPLLKAGDVLGVREIGLLAGAGIDKVFVRPRPRVVVIGSGEGLVEPSEHSDDTSAIDVNSYLIAAAARAAGAQVFHHIVSTSDPDQLARAVTDQLIRADLVISTTGGRRQDYETMAETMQKIGRVDSAEVATTPGRTQTFGLVGPDDTPMLMLPGNPVSAYVSFQAFGWPLIKKLAGSNPERKLHRGIATATLRSTKGQTHLLRGTVTNQSGINRVSAVSEPHALRELANSNVLIVLDEDVELVNAGENVWYWQLDED